MISLSLAVILLVWTIAELRDKVDRLEWWKK